MFADGNGSGIVSAWRSRHESPLTPLQRSAISTTAVQALSDHFDGKLQDLSDRFDGRLQDLSDRFDGKLDALETRLSGRIDELSRRVDELSGRVDGLEAKLDAHARDTRRLLLVIVEKLSHPRRVRGRRWLRQG